MPGARTKQATLVAVDGGGSKIDVALLGDEGRLLGARRWRGSTYEGRWEGDLRGLVAAIDAVCADAGIDPGLPVAPLGVYCLTGVEFPAGSALHPPRPRASASERDRCRPERHLRRAACRQRGELGRGRRVRSRDQLHRRGAGRTHGALSRARGAER